MKFIRLLLIAVTVSFLSGCSTHGPKPSEINSLCRAEAESGSCLAQEKICSDYNSVLRSTFASASDCRKACENVGNNFSGSMNAQGCDRLFDNISGLCSEFCDSNYK